MPARLLDAPYQVRIVWIVAGGRRGQVAGRQKGVGGRWMLKSSGSMRMHRDLACGCAHV